MSTKIRFFQRRWFQIFFGGLLLSGFLLVHSYWLTVGFVHIWTNVYGALAILGHLVISLALAYDVYSDLSFSVPSARVLLKLACENAEC